MAVFSCASRVFPISYKLDTPLEMGSIGQAVQIGVYSRHFLANDQRWNLGKV